LQQREDKIMRIIVAVVLAALMAAAAAAEEKSIDLKKAPGLDKVEGHCAACHSLDYIEIALPQLGCLGCGGHEYYQGIRRADRRRRCQGDRRLSQSELWRLSAFRNSVGGARKRGWSETSPAMMKLVMYISIN
jgi:mono/diheme cytochrome c family protein